MALWDNVIGYGTHADRPAAGAVGALYFESDTNNGYRDNGVSWDIISVGINGRRNVYTTATDLTLEQANSFVVVTATPTIITLPDPVANIGLSVAVLAHSEAGLPPVIHKPNGDLADGSGQNPWVGISDGTQWWLVDF